MKLDVAGGGWWGECQAANLWGIQDPTNKENRGKIVCTCTRKTRNFSQVPLIGLVHRAVIKEEGPVTNCQESFPM